MTYGFCEYHEIKCDYKGNCIDCPHTLNQKWIPVSERLPEKDGYYYVIDTTGRVCTYVFHKQGNSEEYWKRCAIAWRWRNDE